MALVKLKSIILNLNANQFSVFINALGSKNAQSLKYCQIVSRKLLPKYIIYYAWLSQNVGSELVPSSQRVAASFVIFTVET